VPLGTYCVVETTTPTGYDTADPQCNQVIDLHAGGRTLSLTFTDPRKYKAIVLVCRQTDDTLRSSAVTIDSTSGGNGNSLTSAQLAAQIEAAVPGVLTSTQKTAIEKKLCNLTTDSQGAKAGLHVGNHSAAVTIP